MPKFVERERVHPVPGAFGLERSKVDWERRCRPNAQYLTRTGHYADKLYIYVDEEYGFGTFLWVYPGTAKELVEDWCLRRTPWREGVFKGEFDPVNFQTIEADREKPYPRRLELVLRQTRKRIEGFSRLDHFDGQIHIHEEDDSYLKVDYYEVNGMEECEVIIHVLDALAAIP